MQNYRKNALERESLRAQMVGDIHMRDALHEELIRMRLDQTTKRRTRSTHAWHIGGYDNRIARNRMTKAEEWVVVWKTGLNVRLTADVSSDRVRQLKCGTRFKTRQGHLSLVEAGSRNVQHRRHRLASGNGWISVYDSDGNIYAKRYVKTDNERQNHPSLYCFDRPSRSQRILNNERRILLRNHRSGAAVVPMLLGEDLSSPDLSSPARRARSARPNTLAPLLHPDGCNAVRQKINQLPVLVFKPSSTAEQKRSEAEAEEAEECPECCSICLEVLQEGDTMRTLPCFHRFHVCCIDSWLVRKPHCPLCRAPALPKRPGMVGRL